MLLHVRQIAQAVEPLPVLIPVATVTTVLQVVVAQHLVVVPVVMQDRFSVKKLTNE